MTNEAKSQLTSECTVHSSVHIRDQNANISAAAKHKKFTEMLTILPPYSDKTEFCPQAIKGLIASKQCQ